jgi:hypothetical protein
MAFVVEDEDEKFEIEAIYNPVGYIRLHCHDSHGAIACVPKMTAQEARRLALELIAAAEVANGNGMKPSCGTCKFYADKLSRKSSVRYEEGVGECRRHAPRGPVSLGWSRIEKPEQATETHVGIMTPFPLVPNDDWCGDFETGSTDV